MPQPFTVDSGRLLLLCFCFFFSFSLISHALLSLRTPSTVLSPNLSSPWFPFTSYSHLCFPFYVSLLLLLLKKKQENVRCVVESISAPTPLAPPNAFRFIFLSITTVFSCLGLTAVMAYFPSFLHLQRCRKPLNTLFVTGQKK